MAAKLLYSNFVIARSSRYYNRRVSLNRKKREETHSQERLVTKSLATDTFGLGCTVCALLLCGENPHLVLQGARRLGVHTRARPCLML